MPDLADALLAFAAAALALHLTTAAIAAVRCARRDRVGSPVTPHITILRPVCGVDEHDALTLGSTFDLDYPAYDIVFCAASANDAGAMAVLELSAKPTQRATVILE